MAIPQPFRSWLMAYAYARVRSQADGYRYRVRADRARSGLWLVSRSARRVRGER